MKAVQITAPTKEPVSTDGLAEHLMLDDDHPDRSSDVLVGLEKAARQHVEEITRRAILTQTWDYYLQGWPDGDRIILPLGRLQSVTHVKYKDTDGDETTMTVDTDYLVETNGDGYGYIVLPYGESWPGDSLYPSNPITVRIVCGWTTAALVPFQIKSAIKMVCADLYENRGEPIIGQSRVENPAAQNLLASWRLHEEF